MADCMHVPMPIVGKVQPHQRPDGTFTKHEYESFGTDYRHQFTGYDVECEIFICTRVRSDGRICGREKSKPIACIMKGK